MSSKAVISNRRGNIVPMLDEAREHFQKWFVEPLNYLYTNEHAGFAIVMLSLPLLERYLRQKSGVHEKTSLDSRFFNELFSLFPTLGDTATARDFWRLYRHGLLHQATLKTEIGTLEVSVKNDIDAWPITVSMCSQGRRFIVAPVVLSKMIIGEIESNFSTFIAPNSTAHPLSTVAISAGSSGVYRP